jgi:formylglycine-generating enzyme required for sulfatase activity
MGKGVGYELRKDFQLSSIVLSFKVRIRVVGAPIFRYFSEPLSDVLWRHSMMARIGKQFPIILIFLVSCLSLLLYTGPRDLVLGSDEVPEPRSISDPNSGHDHQVSSSKLYEAISAYLDGLHGKGGATQRSGLSGPTKGQRREATILKPLENEDLALKQVLDKEKAVAKTRLNRQEWDLALESLRRATKVASRLDNAEELKNILEMQQVVNQKSRKLPKDTGTLKTEITNSIGMKLVLIPAATFTMGSSTAEIRRIRNEWNVEEDIVKRESPAHSVQISKPFLMGKYNVTVGQFKIFVQETGYQTVAEAHGWGWVYDGDKKHWTKRTGVSWKNPGNEVWDDHPVSIICFTDAEAFCTWLSKKDGRRYELPTEAQWEYAARGGKEGQRYSWGDEYPDGRKLNMADRMSPVPWADRTVDDHYAGSAPVGCFDPNGFWLYDMLGNVWQLCADYYDPKAYEGTASKVTTDPRGPRTGKKRVVRGGNWAFGAGIARNAFRFGIEPDLCTDLVGFRVTTVAGPDENAKELSSPGSSFGKISEDGDVEGLLDRVKSLVTDGRRLEARKLVERFGRSDSLKKGSLDHPDVVVREVLDTLIDLTEDTKIQSFANSIGMKMVRIPAGSFVMGSSESDIAWAMSTLAQNQPVTLENEHPFHKVRISRPFFMSATEVTVGQFQSFVDATGYVTDAEDAGGGQVFNTKNNRFDPKEGSSWKNPGWTVSQDQPVTMVSHNDAQAFVEWLTAKDKLPYKLPTEAQWEYAARGGLPITQFPWGDSVPDGRKANYADKNTDFDWRDRDADDGYKYVAPVGSYPANGYGLYDMAGNVIEWVRDYYGEEYFRFSPEVDPEGPGHGENRITKGGDWSFGAVSLRCAFRGWSRQDLAFSNTGFRVIVETAGTQRMFDFADNFLTKEWVPGPDQRAVTEAIAKEKDRRSKQLSSQSEPTSKTKAVDVPLLKGVMVLDLTPKSDARKVGLAKGDIIIEYNGSRNFNSEKFIALTAKTKKERTKPIMVFVRDGYEYSVRVAPGFLGIAVIDTTVRGPLKKLEPSPEQTPQEDKNKKSKPAQWT